MFHSYIVRKFKDTNRVRPIVSYCPHPMKRLLHVGSIGYMTCLKHLDFPHFNVFAPLQSKFIAYTAFLDLNNVYGEDIEFFDADIKEMYTFLPHDKIIISIKFVLQHIKKTCRRSEVTVNLQCSKLSRLGRAYIDIGVICISFETLFLICAYDIENSYFILNQIVMRQKLGIPMGTPGAPGYSMSACIYCEKQFWDAIYDYQFLLKMFRYFDDLRAITVFKSKDLTTKNICKKLLAQLQNHCYDPSLKVVEEKHDSNNSFKFLESVITYQHNEFSSRYCVKNFNSLLDEGKLKFLGAQDLYSFTGQRKLTIRKATVKGKLSTLMGYCFSDKDILQAFGQLLVYLHALHYPKWIIVGELHKLYESSRETIWKLLAVLTQNAYPSITSSSSTKMR